MEGKAADGSEVERSLLPPLNEGFERFGQKPEQWPFPVLIVFGDEHIAHAEPSGKKGHSKMSKDEHAQRSAYMERKHMIAAEIDSKIYQMFVKWKLFSEGQKTAESISRSQESMEH